MSDFNIEKMESAYGYNGESKVLADTPSKSVLYSYRQKIDVPQGLSNNSTFYEYDINGKLLGWQYQGIGSEYLANDNNARIIEGIYGRASDRPDVTFGVTNILLPTDCNYRVYMCNRIGGVTPDEKYFSSVALFRSEINAMVLSL